MTYSTKEIGNLVRKSRKDQHVTQKDLALTAGVGLRFISDLENGKESCEIGKILTVLQTLNISIKLEPAKRIIHE